MHSFLQRKLINLATETFLSQQRNRLNKLLATKEIILKIGTELVLIYKDCKVNFDN